MKTVITSSGNYVGALFDQRFGRAAWFCLFDEETGDADFYENEFVDAGNGAGVKAAEKVVGLEAGKVISGDFGPKAKDILDKLDVQMVVIQDQGFTVKDVINKLKSRL